MFQCLPGLYIAVFDKVQEKEEKAKCHPLTRFALYMALARKKQLLTARLTLTISVAKLVNVEPVGHRLEPPDLAADVDRAVLVGLRQQDVPRDGAPLAATATHDLDGGHGALELAAEVGAL